MANLSRKASICLGLMASFGSCWHSASSRKRTPVSTSRAPLRIFEQQLAAGTSSSSSNGDVTVNNGGSETSPVVVPPEIVSPVLRQVYPKMLQHIEEYGNPNIPLGTSEGRQCETLRRLHIQKKLTDDEVNLLTDLGFLWHDLEDVYKTADFDDLFQRLLEFRDQNDGDLSPPKKYNPDPELGAWVTGIRRLGPDQVDPKHRQQLDEVGFCWISQRKCGSSFMAKYREIAQQLDDGANPEDVWANEGNYKWLRAQQLANQRNGLSETRQHYLEQMLGPSWTETDASF